MFLVQKLKIIVRKLIPITKRLLFGMDIVSDQTISVLDFTKIAKNSGFFERGDLFIIWSTPSLYFREPPETFLAVRGLESTT